MGTLHSSLHFSHLADIYSRVVMAEFKQNGHNDILTLNKLFN